MIKEDPRDIMNKDQMISRNPLTIVEIHLKLNLYKAPRIIGTSVALSVLYSENNFRGLTPCLLTILLFRREKKVYSPINFYFTHLSGHYIGKAFHVTFKVA